MINAIGAKVVAKEFNVSERTVYFWGENPEGEGRRPSGRLQDYLLTHPKTEKFRLEFLMTITVPAGYVPTSARKLKRLQSVMNRGLTAIAGGVYA